MKIYCYCHYYCYYYSYYINYNDIRYMIRDSELSDFQKYNAIKLLTYYLVYYYFSFTKLKKLIKKYNVEFIETKTLSDKESKYLYFMPFNNYYIRRNVCNLLDNVLLFKKYNIIYMYINLLFNNNKYSNIIKKEVMYYVIDKIFFLNVECVKYDKYLIIEKKYVNINKYLLINKNIYYNIQKKICKNKYYTRYLKEYIYILYK